MKNVRKPNTKRATREEKYFSNEPDLEAEESKKELKSAPDASAFPFSNPAEPTERSSRKINSNTLNDTSDSRKRRIVLPQKAVDELQKEGIKVDQNFRQSAESFLELSLVQKEGKEAVLEEEERKLLEENAKKLPKNVKNLLNKHLDEVQTMAQNLDDDALMNVKLDLGDEENTQAIRNDIQQNEEKIPAYIIRASSVWRLRWDLFVILLVIYNCISIPLEIAFPESGNSLGSTIVDNAIDICFALDIICNFLTTYINEKTGLEEIECKKISKNYVHQWRFWIDLAATIPFEYIYIIFSGGSSDFNFSIFDLLKLIRLLRLGRIISYMKVKQDVKAGFRIVQLLSFLLLLVHWVGCMWYIMVRKSNWIPPKDLDSGETNFYEVSAGYQYSYVFYYAILLLVGNESAPTTMGQTIFSSLVVIMGSIITAFIFGNMAALMAAMNQKDQQFQEQYDKIMSLMRSIMLPEEVQEEVDAYLMHIQQVPDLQQDMETFLELLSPALRSQILFHMYKTIIRKIEIFDNCSDIELRYIVVNMKTVIFLPNDEIIRQGDNGDNLYFLSRGSADVFIDSDELKPEDEDQPLKTLQTIPDEQQEEEMRLKLEKKKKEVKRSLKILKEGDYFGEIALMTSLQRTATVKAKEFCTLGFLTKKVFQTTKLDYPQIWRSFKKEIMSKYKDENFEFRKNMILNVPYFKNLNEEVVQELVYLMKSEKHDPNSLLIKRGDSTNKIFLLKFGRVDIEVPLKNGKLHFDVLNSGSCICIYSAFHEERKQKFDFRCKSRCSIETIKAQDIINLEKEQLELSDELRALRAKIENNEKTGFDFFRYVPPNMIGVNLTEEKKQLVRKKMRIAITNFGRQFKSRAKEAGENVEEMVKMDFQALYALNELEKERVKKERRIEFLKNKSSGAYQLKNVSKLDKKGKTLKKINDDDDDFLDGDKNAISLFRAKTDFKNLDMSRSFINQSIDQNAVIQEKQEQQEEEDMNQSISKKQKQQQLQIIEEEEQKFFHNDDRLRHEQVHDSNLLRRTGYMEVQKKIGKYEGSEKQSQINNASEVESIHVEQDQTNITKRELALKDEALKKVKQSYIESQESSKLQPVFQSQNSLKGELNSKLPIKEGDVALPIMGGGPGMQDTVSNENSPRNMPSRILANLTLDDPSASKTIIKESGDSRISDVVPLISQHKRSYSKVAMENQAIQKPILHEINEKDTQEFLKQQQQKKHYHDKSGATDISKLSDISKCPFMTRHYAELQGANDPEFLEKNQEIIQEWQTKKFMERAKFVKNQDSAEKKLGFVSPRETEEFEDGKDLFEGVDSPTVRLGKQLKGEGEIFTNQGMEKKISKNPSTFAKMSAQVNFQEQAEQEDIKKKPLTLKDLPQKDSKADVQTKPSSAGGGSIAFTQQPSGQGLLGGLKKEEEKKPAAASGMGGLGGLFGGQKKEEEKKEETGPSLNLFGAKKTEDKPASSGGIGGLGGLFGGGGGKQASSGGGGMGSKLLGGLTKNLVGSEADVQIIQMLSIINKSIQTQQESVSTLARSMNKRFKTLDAKLNAIQIQKNLENDNGQCHNCAVSSRRTSDIKSESLLQQQQKVYGKVINQSGITAASPLAEKRREERRMNILENQRLMNNSRDFDDKDEVETSKNFQGPMLKGHKSQSSFASSPYEDENVPTDNDGSRPFFSVSLRQQQYLTQNNTREAQNFGSPIDGNPVIYDQKDTIFTNNRPAAPTKEAFENSIRHIDQKEAGIYKTDESMANYQESAPSFPPNEGAEVERNLRGEELPKIKNPGTSTPHQNARALPQQSAVHQRNKGQKVHGKYQNINIQNQYNNIIHVNDEKMLAQLLQKEAANSTDTNPQQTQQQQHASLSKHIAQQKRQFEKNITSGDNRNGDKSHNFDLTSEEEIHEQAMVDRQLQ